ncbi:MAG: TonB-dependent receptor [Bacteroidia bacterium]|nr:TonB-dependent receptor [Bacteroidia bacterium]
MKNVFLIITNLFLCLSTYAQLPGTASATPTGNSIKGKGKIMGAVLEAEEGITLEFATLTLFHQQSEKLIDGTITDNKGKFSLAGLADGTYKLEISHLSYEKKIISELLIEKGNTLDLGDITLNGAALTLDEVTISGQTSLIEEKVDRLVYNAEKDILAKGGDATDVMRKVPLLQVDLEGNLSLRGSSNIRVLINNKPSTIMAASVADALKMIPADMIKKVEVITSPSAKYDAEGSAGIINIITKKNNLEGYYLNLNTGIGLRGSNLGLNGSYRKGKFGLSLGGHGRAFYNKAETEMTQMTTFNGIRNLSHQQADATDNGIFGRYSLGFDYDIDKTQFISGNVRYGIRRFSRDQLQSTEVFVNEVLQNSSLRDISSTRYSGSVDVNLDYLKVFKPQQEWSISTLYSRDDMNNNFVSDNLSDNNEVLNSLKNRDNSLNQEVTVQTDFITPIGDKQIFEVGAKGIFRMVNSDYSYLVATASEDFSLDISRPAGTLDYGQNVTAAYTSYTLSVAGDYTFKGGVRWERTYIDATQDESEIEIPDYSNIVPSLNISKKLGPKTTLKLGYNRRIQRPWLRQLNPNVDVQNSQDIQVGNPKLTPELTDNIELGVSTNLKKTYLNVSVFGRLTENAINRVRYPLDSISGAILTTYENIGKEKALGTNVFANVYLTPTWTINGGFDIYYATIEGQVQSINGTSETAKNSGYNFGGRLMSQVSFNSGWSIQAFSFMRGRRVELQGSRGGFGMYGLGMNKDFNNKKGSLGIAAENFAGKGWNVRSELNSPIFSQSNSMLLFNRNIKVNFTYKFGTLEMKDARRKTRSVRNDDLMQGGNDSMGGGNSGASVGRQGQGRRAGKVVKKAAKDKKKALKKRVKKQEKEHR